MPQKVVEIDLSRNLVVLSSDTSYQVNELQECDGCLFVGREMVAHSQYRYLRSCLISEWSVQLCKYFRHDGHEHWCDWYADIGRVWQKEKSWFFEDLYVDVGVKESKWYEVLDCDDLAEALARGEISSDDAGFVMKNLQNFLDMLRGSFSLEDVMSERIPLVLNLFQTKPPVG